MSTSKKARSNKGSTNQIQINGFEPIIPKNFAQDQYLEAIRSNDIIFGTGPAGTGKTYIAAAYAAEQLYYKNISKIVITRPAVEAEESLGYLPGELNEKFAPYLAPLRDIFDRLLGKSFVDYCLKTETIEAIPIAYMRGRTFDNSIVLITEAQNTTPNQMKLILSRIGEGCKYIVEGDISQKDIKGTSGMDDALNKLNGVKGIDHVNFMVQDIVRSTLCRSIIMRYTDF